MLLQPTGFESPFWGKVQEIRDVVIDFRKSGKPVYAYLDGGDREFYLSTAADKFFLMPSSLLDPAARHLRVSRGTLDKIGAYPDLHHIGQHTPRKPSLKGYTLAHKEMDQALNQISTTSSCAARRRPEEGRSRRARCWTRSLPA